MAMDAQIVGGSNTANVSNVDAYYNQMVTLPNTPAATGKARIMSENDDGLSLGIPNLMSPETDSDYRLRVSQDLLLDEEDLTSTAQNFTKHAMYATTFVPSWTSTGFNTNPTSLLTAGAAVCFKTYKTFAMQGTETLSFDAEVAYTYASGAVFPAAQVVEYGFGLTSNTTPYDSFDSVMYRTTNAGTQAILRNNSNSDTVSSGNFLASDGVSTWHPVSGRKYQIILYQTVRECEWWIADPVLDAIFLAAELATPPGYGAPVSSGALQMFVRHYQATAPTVAGSFTLSRYSVRKGGVNISTSFGESAARNGENIYSPGTLTTTANQTITSGSITRPTAAVPSNTAAMVTSLSGILVETGTLAIGTDGILLAFQNPALPTAVGTTYNPNRRLRIDGVSIASGVTTAFATGGFTKMFYVAYGSTAVSLAGVATDTVTTKAYRRVQLGIAQYYTATHAPGATVNATASYERFASPIYVNPGEFVALVTFHAGTVGTTGVITHAAKFDFTWE